MLKVCEATPADFKTIQHIAHTTWPLTYSEILTQAQLDFMLAAFYSIATLTENYSKKQHHFILAVEEDSCLGFASFEHHYLGEKVTRLHKLYLLPEAQGKGIGKMLVDRVEAEAKNIHSNLISLNVNKYNKAYFFYEKIGFQNVGKELLPIGDGYFMDDFKMEKKLLDL